MIGFLSAGSPDSGLPSVAGFRQGLNETGYVEGQNITVEYRWAEGKPERFPALAAELVRLNVDVIVTAGGTLAVLAAKRATTTLPIVFCAVGDPVAEGLVTSLARPGGNVTGFSFFAAELVGKRLELLKQAVPGASLIALLLKPDSMPDRAKEARLIALLVDPSIPRETEAASPAKGVQLHVLKGTTEGEIDAAFATLVQLKADGLIVDTLGRARIAALASRHAVPAIAVYRDFADAGGLLSYGPSFAAAYRIKGIYAGRILKGERPADLPVQQPTRFELVINLKTAKALGLTVPLTLLGRADEVIE